MPMNDTMRAAGAVLARAEPVRALPKLTKDGQDALRKRLLAASMEMTSVIFESQGLCQQRDIDVLPDEARAIAADLGFVAHRTRELIGARR